MKIRIRQIIDEGITIRQNLLKNEKVLGQIGDASQRIINAFANGKKLLLAGNGGSAADAQHLAAEFIGRFNFDRAPLNAEALSCNSSILTCIGNDYGFQHIFSRAVEAKGTKGDVFIGFSTSGNSPNMVEAAKMAKGKGLTVIGLMGEANGEMAQWCDIPINVPSKNIPRIQECHITIGHTICELVEAELFIQK